MQDLRASLDDIDCRLLHLLQKDAHLTSERLGEALNLSASQAGRRRQRLESAGLIEGYSARLNARAVGLGVQAFVHVEMASHAPDAARAFKQLVDLRRDITSAWTLTGDADYLLRVFCEDLSSLNELIHGVLLPHPSVSRVQSQIVMDELKADAPLPT
ncbi:MAG: Lrp/AsnC family transcriptional regulator [Pseudomonadota bacterium]